MSSLSVGFQSSLRPNANARGLTVFKPAWFPVYVSAHDALAAHAAGGMGFADGVAQLTACGMPRSR